MQFKKQLKAKAHKLNPIVIVGNKGLTENVMKEIDQGLTDHKLMKVRINAGDREERLAVLKEICEGTGAEEVQLIGGVGVIYREKIEE